MEFDVSDSGAPRPEAAARPRNGQPLGALLTALPGSRVGAIGPEGRALFSGSAEKSLGYVTQTDAEQETLTPEEFRAKYDWKN
jgi:hypothetical protein